jgi:hypothetical protein
MAMAPRASCAVLNFTPIFKTSKSSLFLFLFFSNSVEEEEEQEQDDDDDAYHTWRPRDLRNL